MYYNYDAEFSQSELRYFSLANLARNNQIQALRERRSGNPTEVGALFTTVLI